MKEACDREIAGLFRWFKLCLSDQTNDFRRAYLPSFFSSPAKAGALNVTATAMIAISDQRTVRLEGMGGGEAFIGLTLIVSAVRISDFATNRHE
jgi:hypothetical protein